MGKIEFAQTGSQKYGTNWDTYSDYQKLYFKRVEAAREQREEQNKEFSRKKKVLLSFGIFIVFSMAISLISFVEFGSFDITGLVAGGSNFNVSGSSSYAVESHHIGLAGKNTSLSTSFSSRFTGTYQQGGSSGSSTSYSLNVGWFALANNTPIIESVSVISAVDPIEGTYRSVNFSFVAFDDDIDLDAQSAIARFSMGGETTRTGSCTSEGSIDVNRVNFSCSVNMWYFDAPGTWIVNVSVSDIQGNTGYNSSTNFTYNSLTAMTISPSRIEWTINSSAINSTANNFTTVNNTGNVNFTAVKVKAIDLVGSIDSSFTISSGNFTVSNSTSTSPPVECAGDRLINNTNVDVTGLFIARGNNSAGQGLGMIYYCIPEVPLLKRQDYSTNGNPWFIEISTLLAAFSLGRKKKKGKKDEKGDNLGFFESELKKRHGISLKDLNDELKEKFDISVEEIASLIKESESGEQEALEEELSVPISIFSTKGLGPAEILVKYLKENRGKKFSEIASLLNRDDRTIWNEYNIASKRGTELVISESLGIPLKVFEGREKSILETIILHLREKGLTNSEIARMMGKDPRNIYTVYVRARKKI